MSITGENGWGEVERRARLHESRRQQNDTFWDAMLTISHEDRLKGAIVEALSQLEQGHHTAAWQILNDCLKIGGVK